jgi:hypothetical protein
MFIGRDGRTADAEHQQQQRQHIYILYGPPHGQYARFAMLAMFGASTAEVQALLIHSCNFGGFSHVEVCISGNTPSFYTGIFAFYLSGKWAGDPNSYLERCLKVSGRSLTTPYKCDYEFIGVVEYPYWKLIWWEGYQLAHLLPANILGVFAGIKKLIFLLPSQQKETPRQYWKFVLL